MSPLHVELAIDGSTVTSRVSPLFVGSTLDIGFGYSLIGSPSYDLTPPRLLMLARALSPGLLRIGGSAQDKLQYEVDDGRACPGYVEPQYPCPQQAPSTCLTLRRWHELHQFAAEANLSLIFGLNACHGRPAADRPMDLTATIRFLNYTARHGLRVHAFELGNELDGSYTGSEGVAPEALAEDLASLSDILRSLWPERRTRPRLLAPDVVVYTGRTQANPYFDRLLSSGRVLPTALDGITFHQYPYCANPNSTAGTVLERGCLAKLTTAAAALSATGARYGLAALSGEGSNCWTGGVRNVSDVFLDAFYYAFQLSTMATHGVAAVIRQTLLGQIYQLVNATTLHPNPSYWIALLWRRLVGSSSLNYDAHPPLPPSAPLHVSVHCSAVTPGEVIVVAINFASNETYDLTPGSADVEISKQSQESAEDPAERRPELLDVYLLTGDVYSRRVSLNGRRLEVSGSRLPAIAPVQARSPVRIPPASIAFVQTVATGNRRAVEGTQTLPLRPFDRRRDRSQVTSVACRL